MTFKIVPGMLVCSSILISVCIFVSKVLLISNATVIVLAGGATVLFSVCSAVTVQCFVLLTVLRGCVLLCKEEGPSPVSLQLLRRGIWACMRCPCLCVCWVLGWGLC